MLIAIHPKLPMRNKAITLNFYVNKLGFANIGSQDYEGYLMVKKDSVEIHFFAFETLNPKENYGGVYVRTNNIQDLYKTFISNEVEIHPAGPLQLKPWKQWEFSILDPDNNLLTFGQQV